MFVINFYRFGLGRLHCLWLLSKRKARIMFRLRRCSLNKLAENIVFRDKIDVLIEVNLLSNLMELFARYLRIYLEINATA